MDSGAQCVMTPFLGLKQLLLVDNWDTTLTPAILPTLCEYYIYTTISKDCQETLII